MKKRANQSAEAERLKEAAEAEFWRSIDGLRQRYYGAQTDIAEATKYTRDHILKQVKRYTSDAEGGGTQ